MQNIASIPRDTVILPLNRPVHGSVGKDEWRSNVEHLVAESSPGVEDGGMEGTGKGSLAVGSKSVGHDAPLRGCAA